MSTNQPPITGPRYVPGDPVVAFCSAECEEDFAGSAGLATPGLPEVDYVMFCETCRTVLNGEAIEDFDTGRRPIEGVYTEVVRWATERGMTLDDAEKRLIEPGATDHDPEAFEGLAWLCEKAEQHLNGLDGHYFEQDGDAGTTTLYRVAP